MSTPVTIGVAKPAPQAELCYTCPQPLVVQLDTVEQIQQQSQPETKEATRELQGRIQEFVLKLQDQIKALQTQIVELNTKVQSQGQELVAVKLELQFTKTIGRGASGEDVKKLQEFLRSFSDVYPEGVVSGYFGSRTEAAVRKFQEKNGLEPVGVVGPKTRAVLNEATATPPHVTPSGTVPARPAEPFPGTGMRAIPAQPALPAQPLKEVPLPSSTPLPEETPIISEQVTCIFRGSTATQECYASANYGGVIACKGTEACVADVKGYKGEMLTWKSSCGGYAYTTVDGSNEKAEFVCNVAEPERLPDVTVFDIYSDAGKLSVKIGNLGVDTASVSGYLYIWIDGVLKWTYSFSTLADQSFLYPGGTTVIQPQILSGEHKIKATIDSTNAMAESNESNNTMEKTVIFETSTNEIVPPSTSGLPAPTGLKPGFGTGGNVPNWAKTAESLSFSFDASSLSKVSAFRLYQKRPQDAAFTMVGEFSDPSSLISCSSSKRTYSTWYLSPIWGSSCPNSMWSIGRTTGPQLISSYAVGDYLYYLTAVDASGKEGSASITAKSTLLAPFTIQSPTALQSPVGPNPTFTWPVVSGWPRTPAYWIFVAPSDATGQAMWQSALTVYGSTGSKVYDGPALDPNKKYVVWVYGHSHNSDQSEDQSSFAMSTETFWVSSSTISSLDVRKKSLADLSMIIDTLRSLLMNLKKLAP